MAAVAFTPVSIQASAARARASVRGARAARAVQGLGSSAALAPRPIAMRASSFGVGASARPARGVANHTVRAMADEEKEDKGAGVKQLLGIRGGERTDNIWKIRLQLTKPVTWVPLIWGVGCGAAASGNYHALWNLFGDGTIPSGDTTTSNVSSSVRTRWTSK